MKTRNIEKGSCRRLVYEFSRLRASSRNLAAMRIIERETDSEGSDVLQSWHLSLKRSHFEEFSVDVREAVMNSISDEIQKHCSAGSVMKIFDYFEYHVHSVSQQAVEAVMEYSAEQLTAGRSQEVDKILKYDAIGTPVFQLAVDQSNFTVLAWYVDMYTYVAPDEKLLATTLHKLVQNERWGMFQYLSDNLSKSAEKHFLARNFELATSDGQITQVGRYLKTCVYGIHDDRQTNWFDEREVDRYYEIRPVLGRVLRKEKIGGDEYYERFAKYAQISTVLPVLESGIVTSVDVLEDFWRSSTIVEQPRRLRRI